MARPLRINLPDTWYHVMNRGHRGGKIFLNETDRRRFLVLLEELPSRFKLEIHAFVLMDNHYHLLVRTREANLSEAIRWLNVSYAIKFNWAHQWKGTVFQGRFKAIVIEEFKNVVRVARYLHLNPVRISGLGLGKDDQRRARIADIENPEAELINRRLARLSQYPWSSWQVYGGHLPAPRWLDTGMLQGGCGGSTPRARRAAIKRYTEEPIRQGGLESPWDDLTGGLVLGSKEFAQKVLSGKPINMEEQTPARLLQRKAVWSEVVAATEKIRGESWTTICGRHGDWARDATLYVAVRQGGLRLKEAAEQISGLKYQAAAQAVLRFAKTLERDKERRTFVTRMQNQISII